MTAITWIAYITSWPLIIYFLLEGTLRKHYDKPAAVKTMRLLSFLALIGLFSLVLQLIFETSQLASGIAHYNINSRIGWLAFRIIGGLILMYAFLFWFRPAWWYCLRHDTKTIQGHWYINKHNNMKLTRDNVGQAFAYLSKASESITDSVFIWAMLAVYNEHLHASSPATEQYLAKAQETAAKLSAKDKGLAESAIGRVLLLRNNLEQALVHLKTARDLDPSDFNKFAYDKALQGADQSSDELK